MTTTQKNNADIIINTFKNFGIDNPYTISAVLGVVTKETQLIPKSENLNYTAKRITQVWKNIPLSVAKTLANNPEKLGNYVYGNRFGNGANEGYLFRGRGFNQLTFKDNYKTYGLYIKENLTNNPDKVNEINTASKVLYWYMKRNADKWNINLNNLNIDNAYNIIYSFNAGKNPSTSGENLQSSDTTGGYLTGKKYYNMFLGYTPETKKKINLGIVLIFSAIAFLIYKNFNT
jgi:predicted chitinase